MCALSLATVRTSVKASATGRSASQGAGTVMVKYTIFKPDI